MSDSPEIFPGYCKLHAKGEAILNAVRKDLERNCLWKEKHERMAEEWKKSNDKWKHTIEGELSKMKLDFEKSRHEMEVKTEKRLGKIQISLLAGLIGILGNILLTVIKMWVSGS